MTEAVNHPAHYGGADNPYEAIKVIDAWQLNFNLGNAVKYISRAGKKDAILQDLRKARWYLDREVQTQEAAGQPVGELREALSCLDAEIKRLEDRSFAYEVLDQASKPWVCQHCSFKNPDDAARCGQCQEGRS